MTEVLIAGAGLTGLACAFHLLEMGLTAEKVKLVDARQELGSPNRSSGLLLDTTRCSHLLGCLDGQLQLQDLGDNRSGLRREWLEKSIGIHLTKAGATIDLKRRIDDCESTPKGVRLSINQGKEAIEILGGIGILVDALGSKPRSSGFPGDCNIIRSTAVHAVRSPHLQDIREWLGTLIPSEDEHIDISPIHTSFLRGDGLREEWTREPSPDLLHSNDWTEIMVSRHPPKIDEFSVDVIIQRGTALAEAVLSNPLLSKT